MDEDEIVDDVIRYCQKAVDDAPDDDPEGGSRFMNLAAALEERYLTRGQIDDLDLSIQYFQQAIEASTKKLPDLADWIGDLGGALVYRFQATGQLEDLELSIQYTDQAVQTLFAAPDRHVADVANLMRDVAVGRFYRYRRTGKIRDLQLAVESHQEHVDLFPSDTPGSGGRFQDLGVALQERFRVTGQINDLEQAIQYYRQALNATPEEDSHPDRVGRFHNLGCGLHDLYVRIGGVHNLEQAIHLYKQAIAASPDGHSSRASLLLSLGQGLRDQYRVDGHVAGLEHSTKAFKESFYCSASLPIIRIGAGQQAIQNLIEMRKWDEGARLAEESLQLLPQVTSPTGSRSDLQYLLRSLAGYASQTASILLKAGRSPFAALQALERGRGIIASLMMDARSDISVLGDRHPELWSRYKNCREQISLLSIREEFNLSRESRIRQLERSDQRQKLAKILNDLQTEIRQRPGSERFLLAPTETEMKDIAQDGPLVYFNISNISSEAFLVTTADIQVLHLPNLKEEDIQHDIRVFASRGNSARRDITLNESDDEECSPTADVSPRLWALWTNAVRPVLEHLGLLSLEGPGLTLRRIWWIGGGEMALMPLHAAGEHTLGSTNNTLHWVISSYAPTLKALQFSRSGASSTTFQSGSKPKILIVSMPTTPGGHKALDLAREVATIQDRSKNWASVVNLDRPTKASVLNELRSCAIVHFACHGTADRMEPAKSALLLGRDTLERLTLEDMDTIIHQDSAHLAYLSACSTAEFKVKNLADESIHLASAFQLAGFTHVIGTLWAAQDNAAVQIASNFYESLSLDAKEGGSSSVAHALHNAILYYRNSHGSNDVSAWAPFIHLGC